MKLFLPKLVAALFVWVIPLCVDLLDTNREGTSSYLPVVFGWMLVALFVCAIFRGSDWATFIWVPMALCIFAGAIGSLGGLGGTGSHGPNTGPGEATAIVFLLGLLVILAGLGFAAFWFRPRVFPIPTILISALLNAAACGIVTSRVDRHVTRQDIVLHILDRDGHPVAGASVRYQRYGYGSGGSTVFDDEGGPILSDSSGVVIIPSRQMRYETRVTIFKPEYRDLLLTLEMQFNKNDKKRKVVISTRETKGVAGWNVPATNPVEVTVYLPPASDARDSMTKRIGLYSKRDVGEQSAKYLDLSTGKFTVDQSADLKLELSLAIGGDFSNRRLRIIGLNGFELLMLPSKTTFDGVSSTYEQIFRIAPTHGYQSEITLEGESYRNGHIIYFRTTDRKLHGRLHLDAQGDLSGQDARYSGDLFINSSGSRLLE